MAHDRVRGELLVGDSATFRELAGLLDRLPLSIWGLADITGLHDLSGAYPRALSLALGYSFDADAYDENAYHSLLDQKRRELEESIGAIRECLAAAGIKHLAIPSTGQDPHTLKAVFPHKLAAVRAGLGWIGKSSLLITAEYGPRVRLATILVDGDWPCGQPVTAGRCGGCDECVKACPYRCVNGIEWQAGTDRDALLDYRRCSKIREEAGGEIGHKHACGLCLLACPVGTATHI